MLNEFDLCKEQYFREFERKDSLTSSLALPVGIGTVIASGLLYVANSIGAVESKLELLIVIFVFSGGFFLLLAIYSMCRSYIGYTYQHVPTLAELRDYKQNLKKYYEPDEKAGSIAAQEAYEYLTEKLASSAHNNSANNDRKSGYLYLATRSLVLALGCLLVAGIPLVFDKFELSATSIMTLIGTSN